MNINQAPGFEDMLGELAYLEKRMKEWHDLHGDTPEWWEMNAKRKELLRRVKEVQREAKE